jgi:C4-dicarboxylate-specific signal transduction histidine kinase
MTKVKITGFIFYTGVAVFFSAALSNLFRKREKNLREQKDQLSARAQALGRLTKKLEEIKSSLEIRILARTRELQEGAQKLEEQVQGRTRELRDKITELEKFNSLAVGRELKMVELKEEIARLNEELRHKKKTHK